MLRAIHFHILCLCAFFAHQPGWAGEVPRHTIALSFDLTQSLVRGTSHIHLPAGESLDLDCGPLQLTGAVVSSSKTPPLAIRTDSTNRVHLGPASSARTLLISWQRTVRDSATSYVAEDGITLTGFWHPQADRPMLFALQARFPPAFRAITEAERLDEGPGRLEAAFSHPLTTLHFAAGPYRVRQRRVEGTTVFTYLFPEDADLASIYLDNSARYLKRYQTMLGAFPYERYSIVENRLPTGTGLPTFTLLGQQVMRLPFIPETSLGHELLHSWFGNAITVGPGGNWCEGLTTYLADQGSAEDEGNDSQFRKDQLLRYHNATRDQVAPLATFAGVGDGSPLSSVDRAIGYDKGSMFFHMLRGQVGDEAFFAALRRLWDRYRFQAVSWTQLEAVFTETAQEPLKWFFQQWLERTDLPDLTIDKVRVDQTHGRSRIRITLAQNTATPFRLQVPLELTTISGKTQLEQVFLNHSLEEVELFSQDLPVSLRLDPHYDLMRQLSPEEVAPILSRYFGAPRRSILLAGDPAPWQPLLDRLTSQGCHLYTNGLPPEVLATSSVLFLGSSAQRTALFGKGRSPLQGTRLEVRTHPLNRDEVMVLVDTDRVEDIGVVASKLRHYGRYSRLDFRGGVVQDLQIRPSEAGIIQILLEPPLLTPAAATQPLAHLVGQFGDSRILYIGERHTDYGTHLFQLQLLQALHAKYTDLVIGLEMFPRTVQPVLDAYMGGAMDEETFLKQSRYFTVWGYDYRLYRPIINYAKEHGIGLLALNLERDIIATVARQGSTQELPPLLQQQLPAERVLDLPGYHRRLQETYAMHPTAGQAKTFAGFLQAQVLWDETMAETIASYLAKHPEQKMFVLAGAGHVDRTNGIPPRVARRLPVKQTVLLIDDDQAAPGIPEADYLVHRVARQLPPTAVLGVHLRQDTDELILDAISSHGKAWQAGLRTGDAILAVNGRATSSLEAFKLALFDHQPGDTVTVRVRRDQATLELAVELSAQIQPGLGLPPDHPSLDEAP